MKIRHGVRFSPPVNREVTSRDVKYAIERGFFKTVANAYAGSYFGGLAGARQGVAPGTRIRGIQTPDASTIVFRLTRPTGGALAGALALPLSAPVPPEYAARFDAHNPTDYGTHQVATGPYMIASDGAAGPSATSPTSPSASSATRTGARRPTIARRTSTGSRSSRATTTRASPPTRSSPAGTW